MQNILKLSFSINEEIVIRPRWPSRYVYVTSQAYQKIKDAQIILNDDNLSVVLTRGYEKETVLQKQFHKLARMIAKKIFCLIYSNRKKEANAIFSPNGHDVSGNCLDVSIMHNGRVLNLLPYSVFTPLDKLIDMSKTNEKALNAVWDALRKVGFKIHPNQTESLQIHCELSDDSTDLFGS